MYAWLIQRRAFCTSVLSLATSEFAHAALVTTRSEFKILILTWTNQTCCIHCMARVCACVLLLIQCEQAGIQGSFWGVFPPKHSKFSSKQLSFFSTISVYWCEELHWMSSWQLNFLGRISQIPLLCLGPKHQAPSPPNQTSYIEYRRWVIARVWHSIPSTNNFNCIIILCLICRH